MKIGHSRGIFGDCSRIIPAMAYVALRKTGKWVAQIQRHGTRLSRADFASRDEAQAWADREEGRILSRAAASKALSRETFGAVLPKRVLQGRAWLPIPEAELLQTAIPAAVLCGVYFLIRRSEVVYVGQSVNVFARLAQHLKGRRITFDSFNVVPCKAEDLDSAEAHYIAALVPRNNRSMGEVVLPEAGIPGPPYVTNAEDARAHGGIPYWKRRPKSAQSA